MMIDKACGFDADEYARTVRRQSQIMEDLLAAVESWHEKDNADTRNELRRAWKSVLDEDQRATPPRDDGGENERSG